MTRSSIYTLLKLIVLAAVVPALLCGCGGGGSSVCSSASVPAADGRGDGLSVRSVKLNTYNMWEFGNTSESASVLDQRLEVLARHDNIDITECEEWPNDVQGWRKLTPQSIKSVNPAAKVYRHWYTVKAVSESDWGKVNPDPKRERIGLPLLWDVVEKNDWWLRDGNGNKVDDASDPSRRGTMWHIDLGKPGLKEAYLQSALERMSGKGFDGVVFDGAMQELSPWLNGRPFPTQLYKDDEDWYERAWQPFMSYVVQGFRQAGYRVIENCGGQYASGDPKKEWNRSEVDGVIYEQGAVGWQGEWLPGSCMEERINAIAGDPLEVWLADGGLSQVNVGDDYDRKQTVSLAMYYVAVPASRANRSYHHKCNGKVFWNPVWDFYIGTPAEPPVKQAGRYFWSRRFTLGLVLLNYEPSGSINYSLSGSYKDPSGKAVSGTVTIPAHTALILAEQ